LVRFKSSFAEGIAPSSPNLTEPVVPFYPSFPKELLHTKGHTAIGCGCALDLIENVPFVHDTSDLRRFDVDVKPPRAG